MFLADLADPRASASGCAFRQKLISDDEIRREMEKGR
jgi:hypothetical protein